MPTELTPVQVLEQAYALIEKPEGWTTNCYARNREGEIVGALSPDAVCFCTSGAICRVLDIPRPRYGQEKYEPLVLLFEEVCGLTIPKMNDNYDHPQVLEVWQKVIALAKQREQQHD